MDFLLVVTGKDSHEYKDVPFTLDDSCAHGYEPIRIEVVNGRIVQADPEGAWVQQGGG